MDGEKSWKTLLRMDDLGVPLFSETSKKKTVSDFIFRDFLQKMSTTQPPN